MKTNLMMIHGYIITSYNKNNGIYLSVVLTHFDSLIEASPTWKNSNRVLFTTFFPRTAVLMTCAVWLMNLVPFDLYLKNKPILAKPANQCLDVGRAFLMIDTG